MDNVLAGNYKPFECCVFVFFSLNTLFILSLEEGNDVGLEHRNTGNTRLGFLNNLEVRIMI